MANEMTTVDALQSLKPGAEWVLRGDTLEWLDSKQTEPTQPITDRRRSYKTARCLRW
jgi:hypothetical protein